MITVIITHLSDFQTVVLVELGRLRVYLGSCDPVSTVLGLIWGIPKIRGTFLRVPITRMIVFWGLYWGPTISRRPLSTVMSTAVINRLAATSIFVAVLFVVHSLRAPDSRS